MIFSIQKPQPCETIPLQNCVDIETATTGNVIDIGMVDNDGAYTVYPTWNAWLNDICTRDIKTHGSDYWAHNGGGFDWISLIEHLRETNQFEYCDVILAGSKVIGITIDIKKLSGKKLNRQARKIHLRDSTTLLQASLKKLSKDFGCKTPKIEIDRLPEALKKHNRKLYYDYLRADCIALQEILYGFHEIINDIVPHKKLPATIASCAMSIYRKKYLPRDFHTPTTETTVEFFRSAYRGGRTECFAMGEFHSVNSVDINSLYPSVMKSTPVPMDSSGGFTDRYKKGDCGIFRGEFSTPDYNQTGAPILLDHDSNEYRFNGVGTFCSVEIEHHLNAGGAFNCESG